MHMMKIVNIIFFYKKRDSMDTSLHVNWSTGDWPRISHEAFLKCTHILIFAGAGMSVGSGIPDYRGPNGLWTKIHACGNAKSIYPKECMPHWFCTSPEAAWKYWAKNYGVYRDATPHEGYRLLLEKCRALGEEKTFVVTSNIDGQFQKAGFENVMEIHGSMHRLQKITPAHDKTSEIVKTEQFINSGGLSSELFEGIWRPNVFMFDDANWNDKIKEEQTAKFDKWCEGVLGAKGAMPLVVEIGAGCVVKNVRRRFEGSVRVMDMKSNVVKAWAIRVNPHDPEIEIRTSGKVTALGIPTTAECFLRAALTDFVDEPVTQAKSEVEPMNDDLSEFI
jgi:NAD-dependent SIR2 family protein deacetylase